MSRLCFFRLVVIASVTTSLVPAQEGGRLSPRKHFPERSLVYLEVASLRGLEERLASTLAGRVITHPGWQRAFEGSWRKLAEEVGTSSAPWEELTGKTTRELIDLLGGSFALTVRGLGPGGVEVAAAIEMDEREEEILELLAGLRGRSAELLGSETVESRVGELEVRIWPMPTGPLYEAELGSSLVFSTSPDLLRDIHAAFRGAEGPRPIEESAFHRELEEPLSVSDRHVLLEVNLEAIRALVFPMLLFGENADEVRQLVRLTGIGHLTTLGFALGFRGGGLECAAHLGTREGPTGLVEALYAALPAIDSVEAGLEKIPAKTERISVASVSPGAFLRQLDKLVRRTIPELADPLDSLYRRIEENTTVSVERDVLALEDATFFCFDIEPPAGSLFWDSVALARTEEIEPWWSLLEKGAGSFGIESRTLETSKGKVEYLVLTGGHQLGSLLEEREGPEARATPLALVTFLGLSLTFARWDGPDGWSALSTRPRALVRHAEYYAGEPAFDREHAMAVLAREKLSGATLGCVSSGRSFLWYYNTALGVLQHFSGPLVLAGIDIGAAPPAEVFLDDVAPGYVALRATPRGFTLRGERMLGSSGGLAAIGAASIAAGLAVPWLMHARSSSREIQCLSNLRGLHQTAFVLAVQEGDTFQPPPGGSLAWFEKLVVVDGLNPSNLLCPESSDEEARRRDGELGLTEENVSYGAIGWPVPTTERRILFFDDSPRHEGHRMVVFTDGAVEKLPEAEFQRRLADERRRYGGGEK